MRSWIERLKYEQMILSMALGVGVVSGAEGERRAWDAVLIVMEPSDRSLKAITRLRLP